MLQCRECQQWFHLECIRSTAVPRTMLLGDRFYDFVCTLCTGTCEEEVTRLDLNWADALHLTLFNLTVVNNKKYHDLDTSILPFLKRRWKSLQGPGCLLKMSRLEPEFIGSLLSSRASRFRCGSEIKKRSNYWGLCQVAPPTVSQANNVCSSTPIRAKDGHNVGRIAGGASSSSYSIKQQRRPAMKSSSELNSTDNISTMPDIPTPSLIKPLQPLVLKLNTPSTNDHTNNGSRTSYKNSLLAIKEPYPYGYHSRKHNPINSTKSHKMDSSNNGSFLDPVPIMLSSDNPFEIGSRGLLGGYEFNNGWRNSKAIMRRQNSYPGSCNKSVGSLDTFIPPPKDFDGYNNPFRSFNQYPPILFPQTTLTSYDLLPHYPGKNGYKELTRRQRRLFRRDRHSLLSSRKNSVNSSGDATPERDMDCSSSCSNSVDENVPFLNPPPLLDFSEPLYLAPPSPPSSTSKIVEPSQNDKSPPVLDLFPPPVAYTASATPGEADNITSNNNNNKPANLNGSKTPNVCSNGYTKSIKHKTMSRDLKCPASTKSAFDELDNKYLTNEDGNIVNDKEANLPFSVKARRLTLDGDIQYLFNWDGRGTACEDDLETEDIAIENGSSPNHSLNLKKVSTSSENTELPKVTETAAAAINGEQTVCEKYKKELRVNSDCSLSATTELPVNNTANPSPPSLIRLD